MDQKNFFQCMDPKKFFQCMDPPANQRPTTVERKPEKHKLMQHWSGSRPANECSTIAENPESTRPYRLRNPPSNRKPSQRNETGKTTELTGFGIHGRPRNHRRQHFLHRAAIETARVKPTMWCITRICPPCTPQNPQHASYFVSVFIGLTRAKSMW